MAFAGPSLHALTIRLTASAAWFANGQAQEKEHVMMKLSQSLGLIVVAISIASIGAVASAQSATDQDDLSKLQTPFATATFDLHNVSLATIFQVVATNTGLNIRLSPEVQKMDARVDYGFRDASTLAILRILAKANHLSYAVIDEKTIMVSLAR
jgi:type II secretory pathway component GspD/PulD (secretin)